MTIEWEEILPGRGYQDLATGEIFVVDSVNSRNVRLRSGRVLNIWDFRMHVMPSGRTTASRDTQD